MTSCIYCATSDIGTYVDILILIQGFILAKNNFCSCVNDSNNDFSSFLGGNRTIGGGGGGGGIPCWALWR